MLWSGKYVLWLIKMNAFQGDLANVLAENEITGSDLNRHTRSRLFNDVHTTSEQRDNATRINALGALIQETLVYYILSFNIEVSMSVHMHRLHNLY